MRRAARVLPAGVPDQVIGERTCYGIHVGEGAATVAGPWVVTTQIFALGDPEVAGDHIIVTDGFETPEIGVPINRALTAARETSTWPAVTKNKCFSASVRSSTSAPRTS